MRRMRVQSTRTVRYAFPAALFVSVLLGANVISQQAEPEVVLRVSDTQVVIGETAYLDVFIDTATPINAVTIDITAPVNRVHIDTIEIGNSVITLWTAEPSIKRDTIQLRGGTFRRGFMGEHLIARIPFTPSDSGAFTFKASKIELVAGDGAGTVVTPDASAVTSETIYAFADSGDFMVSQESGRAETFEASIRSQLGIGGRDISLRDISTFMSAWSNRNTVYDFDGDTDMTFRDFAILLAFSFGL